METDIPRRPTRISRTEARFEKERGKLFTAALKAEVKAAGWRYAGGHVFRQYGDWFVSLLPSLLWERGLVTTCCAKPMAVDPIFWSIVGLPENNKLPLSFRANGAWVVQSPSSQDYVALDERAPERLAWKFAKWATDGLATCVPGSVEALLDELQALGPRRGHFIALEICLHLSRNEYAIAEDICRTVAGEESGGFTTGSESFVDQARAWIAERRRGQ